MYWGAYVMSTDERTHLTPEKTLERRQGASRYEISFPSNGALDQDQEWCLLRVDGSERRLRFHDYGEIYEIPGLYEQLFYEHLQCSSPETVVGLLGRELERSGVEPPTLRALDVGAGNGMVGERLATLGAGTIVGTDILPEAEAATERDRPDIYEDYHVLDLTALDDGVRNELESDRFNALTCVAALGFGDMPPAAFATAYDVLVPGAWLAFSIKEDFLNDGDGSGFSRLIRELAERGMVEISAKERYRHRLSANRKPVHYVAIVATKQGAEQAGPIAAEL
jgi:SAM-dependent methyltransferase